MCQNEDMSESQTGKQGTPDTVKPEDTRTLPERDVYSPDDIAVALYGVMGAFQGGKRVRAYLRATYTRDVSQKGKSWILAPDVARDVFDTLAREKVTSAVTLADKKG
jgi:hypothetical protein